MTNHQASICLIAVTLTGFGLASQTAAEPSRLSRLIEGSWTLETIYEEDDSGEDIDRWGNRPTGHFIADASGRFVFQLVGRNPIRMVSANSAPACNAASDRETLAYAGAYTLDPAKQNISLKIEDALSRNWDGLEVTASIAIEGSRMDFVAAAETSPSGSFYSHLVWKRAGHSAEHHPGANAQATTPLPVSIGPQPR